MGDKCTAKFFCLVRQKNSHAIISELKDNYGSRFTRKEDLEEICLDFYQKLYGYREIFGETMQEVLDGLPATFTGDMNGTLTKAIAEKELSVVVLSMATGKVPGHDDIPIKFFQCYWPTIGKDYLRMLTQSMDKGTFHEGITKGFINLISKEGDSKDLNYWRPITLLTAIYIFFPQKPTT